MNIMQFRCMIRVPTETENLETWKKKMVIEKSWNMNNWPKVMEFCDQSCNFTPKLCQICIFFVTSKKLSSNLESLHVSTFCRKRSKCQIGKKDGHGKSRKYHGKIFCHVCGNPDDV